MLHNMEQRFYTASRRCSYKEKGKEANEHIFNSYSNLQKNKGLMFTSLAFAN